MVGKLNKGRQETRENKLKFHDDGHVQSLKLQEQENGCYANQGVMLIKRSILQTYVNFRKRTCLSLNGDCIILA